MYSVYICQCVNDSFAYLLCLKYSSCWTFVREFHLNVESEFVSLFVQKNLISLLSIGSFSLEGGLNLNKIYVTQKFVCTKVQK